MIFYVSILKVCSSVNAASHTQFYLSRSRKFFYTKLFKISQDSRHLPRISSDLGQPQAKNLTVTAYAMINIVKVFHQATQTHFIPTSMVKECSDVSTMFALKMSTNHMIWKLEPKIKILQQKRVKSNEFINFLCLVFKTIRQEKATATTTSTENI